MNGTSPHSAPFLSRRRNRRYCCDISRKGGARLGLTKSLLLKGSSNKESGRKGKKTHGEFVIDAGSKSSVTLLFSGAPLLFLPAPEDAPVSVFLAQS